MSKVRKSIGFVFLLALISFFMIGCKNKTTPVEDIYFDLGNEQIVLLKGDVLNIKDHVVIEPSYATNKSFTLEIGDEEIISINGNKIEAKKQGTTQLTITSNDNEIKQDVITITVNESQQILDKPDVKYTSANSTFNFSDIPNASSYTVRINDDEFSIGNTTSFKLEEKYLNNVIVVRVKAEAPTYSNAFVNSQYSQEITMYQASDVKNISIVDGVLNFDKVKNCSYKLFIGEDSYDVNDNVYSLLKLHDKFANKNVTLSIQAIVNDSVKQQGVIYQNSNKVQKNVNVLDVANIIVNGTNVSWQNVAYATSYDVLINNQMALQTVSNSFDLNSLKNFETLFKINETNTITVIPQIKNTINIAKTEKVVPVSVERLQSPQIVCEDYDIKWNSIENASTYNISLIKAGETVISTATSATSVSLQNRPAGEYQFIIEAIASNNEDRDVYYISSIKATKTVTKLSTLDVKIEDYVLKTNSLKDEKVEISFDGDDATIIQLNELDLSNMQFDAGSHTIKLKRTKANDYIDSDITTINFTQLEKIDTITIENGIVSVDRSDINSNAIIKLITSGSEIDEIEINETSYVYNTTDATAENYLPAADDYLTKVYVYGDGSETFSYREKDINQNMVVVSNCETYFDVLETPTNFEVDRASAVMTFDGEANSYYLYTVGQDGYITINTNSYNVVLESGSVSYQVQAVGDGSTTLNSVLSNIVNINRLVTPKVVFNNLNNTISRTITNTNGYNGVYVLTHNTEEIDFTDLIDYTVDGEHVYTLQEFAVLNDGTNTNFYLNSNIDTLRVEKITNVATFALDRNMLTLTTNHNKEYNLELVFDCAGTEKTYTLSKTQKDLNYTYSNNVYTIELIDEDYNAIDSDMLQGFSVKVKYIPDHNAEGDNLIASEYSEESENFNFVNIASATTISTNKQNQIVIVPANHTQEYNLRVDINGEVYYSINSKLVNSSETIKLNYVYNNYVYYVDILDEDYNPIITTLDDSFNIRVGYSYNAEKGTTDLDSGYSAYQTISFLSASTIVADGQTLKIKNVDPNYDYNNYVLIVNNGELLPLDNTCEIESDYIVIDNNYIFNKVNGIIDGVNNIIVLTINTENDVTTLASKSDNILIEKSNTVTLQYSKNNKATNNSAIISFNTYESDFDKKYVIEISNKNKENLIERVYFNNNATDGVISFSLDDFDLEGEIYIDAKVIPTVAEYTVSTDKVFVFNSNISEVVVVNKINAPTGISVSGTTLTWASNEHAVGYEVYQKTENSFVKLTASLLTKNSYTVNINNQAEFVIKAISNTDNESNSSYSEVITINKIATPLISVVEGLFKVELDNNILSLMLSGVEINPVITNGDKDIQINLGNLGNGLTLIGNIIYVEPELVLKYAGVNVIGEDLTVALNVTKNSENPNIYYINSNTAQITAYGLFAPTDIQKTTNENNSVELITWSTNSKNVYNNNNLDVAYDVKFVYADKEYLTSDAKLKYKNSQGQFVSYDAAIKERNIVFPYGYDDGGNGTIDVVFGAGIYKVSVRTIPTTNTGVNFCKSTFTAIPYEFEIMQPSTLTVQDGVVSWSANPKATEYKLFVYKNNEQTASYTITTKSNFYDFNSNKDLNLYEGVYRVAVKSLTARADALNSAESSGLYVYRLPQVEGFYIEDGKLVMTAVKYFTNAEIIFKSEKHTTYVNFINKDAGKNLQALNISDWSKFSNSLTTAKYEIDISSLQDANIYSISVKLNGNTDTALGLLNSCVAEEKLNDFSVSKLKTNDIDVSTGVVEFMPASSYVELTDINVNYAFNNTNQTTDSFWNKTKIFKISITHAGGLVNIYAVDYFNFIEYFNIDATTIGKTNVNNSNYVLFNKADINTYDLCGYVIYTCADNSKIYFNIYKDNVINLRDYNNLHYYPINESFVNGVNTLTSVTDFATLNLAIGGSFAVDVCMLGGDSTTSFGYLTSNVNNVGTFIRYGEVALSTNNGQVQFKNCASDIDNPVYQLTVKSINNQTEETIFYLYHTTETEAKTVASRIDEDYENAIYLPVTTAEKDNTHIVFDLSQYFEAGNYKVSIRTLAGLGVEGDVAAQDFLLNAKEPSVEYTYKKLTETVFSISNGVLQFNQCYVTEDEDKIYYSNYEITLNDGTKDYVYTINRNSDGVTINDKTHVVTYVLPSAIKVGDTTLTITTDKQYTVKIRGLSVDDYIVNASYAKTAETDTILSFTKSKGISNVRIDEGLLKWVVNDLDNYVETVINIGSTENIIINGGVAKYDESGAYLYHYFEFGDGKYNLETTGSESINSGVNYTVKLYTKGKNNIINSDYTVAIPMTRLATVNASTITMDIDGYLNWEAIDGAKQYLVTISGLEPFIAGSNRYDLSPLNLSVGNYSIKIKAIGTNQIHSMMSTEVEDFVKLYSVSLSSIKISGSNIVWEGVANATGYRVEYNYTPSSGSIKATEVVTECSVVAPTNIKGKFTVTITPIGSGKLINGNSTSYTSSTDAPIGVESVEFDEQNSRFAIKVNKDDFLSGDKLQIIYNFTEYTSSDPLNEVSVKEYIEYQNGVEIYYLYITKIGVYSNINVQVVREGTIPSIAKGVTLVELTLFSYGEGSEANPYRISNSTELLNISYFKNAHYVLTASIRMNDVDYMSRLNTYNAIISDEFTGVLDGNNYSIFDFNTNEDTATDTITLTGANNFALFGSLSGAKIRDLTIGEENIQMILLNMFAKHNSNVINLSMIATGANNNSIIDNVNILNLKIVLGSDETNSINETVNGKVYVSGFVVSMQNASIINSKVKLSVSIGVEFSNDVYLAGAVAQAIGTSHIDNTTINFVPVVSNSNIVTFIGGAIASYEGETSKEKGISNSNVSISVNNVKALYVGGLVGFAKHIKIELCKTSGTITYGGINYETNIGGLVGSAQSSSLTNSGTSITFTITVANVTSKYIGAIAGRLTVNNSVSCEVNGCYIFDCSYEYQEQTSITTSSVTIGMYTHKDTAVIITNCYKKTS